MSKYKWYFDKSKLFSNIWWRTEELSLWPTSPILSHTSTAINVRQQYEIFVIPSRTDNSETDREWVGCWLTHTQHHVFLFIDAKGEPKANSNKNWSVVSPGYTWAQESWFLMTASTDFVDDVGFTKNLHLILSDLEINLTWARSYLLNHQNELVQQYFPDIFLR